MARFFLVVTLLIAPFSALAEGRCPLGQYPIGGQGVGGCAPIPGGSSSPSTGSSAPVPAGKWEARWGAIAEDNKPAAGGLMATGVSVSQKSKRAAEAAAIDGCARRGGNKCEIRLSYHNQCAAIADPSSRSGSQAAGNSIVASAETIDEAQSLALKECASVNSGKVCEVAYSACSMSEFRAYR